MNIRWLGSLELSPPDNNHRSLSALAWDDDEQRLYAVTDRGQLLHLTLTFKNNILTDARYVAHYPLKDRRRQTIRRPYGDSEGLALRNSRNDIKGDSELLVSFEMYPRILRFTPQGNYRGQIPLPGKLRSKRSYVEPNKALEAITVSPQYGILTAPEYPLRTLRQKTRSVPVFDLKGNYWWYPLAPAPNSALVAMEAMAGGSLLTLERAFVSVTRPLIINLRKTSLNRPYFSRLQVIDMAVFDTSKGWLLDNFEGLAQYRKNRFLMVSDDNHLSFQSTLLCHFKLLK